MLRFLKNILFLISFIVIVACDTDEDLNSTTNRVIIEGKSYETITFGDQTWTATNYSGNGGRNFDIDNSKPAYGKYYTKAEVEAIILPEGWRLPSLEDYKKLTGFHGITIPSNGNETEKIRALTSVDYWNNVAGTNSSKFNIYPTGYMFGTLPAIDGDIAEFWMTDGFTLSIQEAGINLTNLRIVVYDSNNNPDYRFTVRFVKDN